MYPLHEMDERYIINSIKNSDVITDYFKKNLVTNITDEIKLSNEEKDIIIFVVKYNFLLSPSYREMLIYKIKEG